MSRRVVRIHLAALLLSVPSVAAAPWQPPTPEPVRTTELHGQRVIPVDIEGDGDVDLVTSYSLTDEVVLELNSGDGSSWQSVQVGSDIVAMFAVAADISGNGTLDIAAVGLFDRDFGFNTEGLVTWYERTGEPDDPWLQHDVDDTLVHARYLEAADVDGDTDVDLVVVSSGVRGDGSGFGNAVVFYENTGGGASWSTHVVASGLDDPEALRLADLDGDTTLDVAVTELGGGRVLAYFNEGNPRRDDWRERTLSSGPGTGPYTVRVADVDGDSDSDLIVGWHWAGAVGWLEQPADPLLDPWPEHPIASGLPYADETVYGDFDNDGLADVAVGGADFGSGAGIFYVYTADGAGGWEEHFVDDYYWFTSVEAADIDRDGDLDLLTSSYEGHRVDWWRNNHPAGGALFADGFESGTLSAWSAP